MGSTASPLPTTRKPEDKRACYCARDSETVDLDERRKGKNDWNWTSMNCIGFGARCFLLFVYLGGHRFFCIVIATASCIFASFFYLN